MSSEIFDNRYIVYRRDRETSGFHSAKQGGGVLIAVHKNITSTRKTVWESNCEDVWVLLNFPKSKQVTQLALCGLYLPPPVNRTMLEEFIEHCCKVTQLSDTHVCLIGDFNQNNIDWSLVNDTSSGYVGPSLSQSLIEFTYLNKFNQLNFIKNANNRILDLVLTNLPTNLCNVIESPDILSVVDSHHPPLDIFVLNSKDSTLAYNDKGVKNNFYRADLVSVQKRLSELDWEGLFDGFSDIDSIVKIFYDELNKLISEFVPKVKIKNTSYPPWFDNNLKRALREKENVRIRVKKYNNALDKLELKLLKKRCSSLSINCYKSYIDRMGSAIKVNPKLFWNFCKAKRLGKSNYPLTMVNEDQSSSNGGEICDMFSGYFKTVYRPKDVIYGLDMTSSFWRSLIKGSLELTVPTLSKSEILRSLKSLNPHKGVGPDGIPPTFIVACADELVHPLHIIYNRSLQLGEFPEVWKEAKVVPIHKGDKKDDIRNYRPISILSTLAKNFESLLCPLIQKHLQLYLTHHQHGFVKHRSTCTNLTTFLETLVSEIDDNKEVDVVYTDFSKAFDQVPHNILLQKLEAYGLAGSLLKWVESYLSDRTYFVVVNGFKSCTQRITSGVPQGSHLGPVLFNAFVNDIPNCLYYCKPYLYADDLKLVATCESLKDADHIQEDLDRLVDWCRSNGMNLNAQKCCFVKFTRKLNNIETSYRIAGNCIIKRDEIRDLGVIFDKKLTFVPHIETTIKKASRIMYFVNRFAKPFKDNKVKILLYYSLVRSILEYCSVVWRPHFATHSLRLERIQKKFLSNLAFTNGLAKKIRSYEGRLKEFNISSLEKRRDILDLTFLHKTLNSDIDCPQLLECFGLRVPRRLPRAPITPLCPPFRKSVLGANSPVPRLCKLLNSYGNEVDIFADSLYGFRKLLIG